MKREEKYNFGIVLVLFSIFIPIFCIISPELANCYEYPIREYIYIRTAFIVLLCLIFYRLGMFLVVKYKKEDEKINKH